MASFEAPRIAGGGPADGVDDDGVEAAAVLAAGADIAPDARGPAPPTPPRASPLFSPAGSLVGGPAPALGLDEGAAVVAVEDVELFGAYTDDDALPPAAYNSSLWPTSH
mmetsp:Transcript_99219/g.286272  ORF Transcript_99219/g.286272 Transcript_99219/m.286272 type:complete len:109 (-) Transcript_99219:1008-1334(-)